MTGVGMNAIETASLSGSEPGEDFKEQLRQHVAASFPRVPSYSRAGVLSASSSTASMPMCRICHHPQGEGLDLLISPCRCAGTMQFIHQGCLNKWLEVKRSKKAPACELCNYQFHRHKKFRLNHWQLPTCSRADKILHSIFLVCLIIMAACATITIICFKHDRILPKKTDDAELTKSEVITLTCGVLFFVAFFVAMYVEVKARNTLYRLFTRFIYLNQTWHIAEYDRRKDSQFGHAPV
ncbi:E3 ubiquitin-protein ligase MARCHF1-like [Penaeus chinensis]|nr:E3 ubiquitin-protein ligase MARCHF1-like [Penaeus chinensis]